MKATSKILVDEHKNILKVADAIEKECEKLDNKELNKNFFLKAVDFIRNYADKFHHAKEEDILFKELEKVALEGKMHCNPIEQMLHDHDEGRGFVKEIIEGIKENNKKKVIKNALSYVELIREHIYKEDNILYPMADDALEKETQKIMLKQFLNAEKERASDKKRCLGIVREFKKR